MTTRATRPPTSSPHRAETKARAPASRKALSAKRASALHIVAANAIENHSLDALRALLESEFSEAFDKTCMAHLLFESFDADASACALHLLQSLTDADCKAIGWARLLLRSASTGMRIFSAVLGRAQSAGVVARHGDEALRSCAHSNAPDKLKALIVAGAPVNAQASNGYTALHYAVASRSIECVRALISAGADIDRANKDHITPLGECALYRESPFHEAMQALLAAGANANPPPPFQTPLCLLAQRHPSTRSIASCAHELLHAGASPNGASRDGSSPLYFAIDNSNRPLARILLSAGADPLAKNNEGISPMLRAMDMRDNHAILDMLESGADFADPALVSLASPEGHSKGARDLAVNFSKANLPELARRCRWSKIVRFIELEIERRALDAISLPGTASTRVSSL